MPAVLMRQVPRAVLALTAGSVWARAHHAHRLHLGGLPTPASLGAEGAADHREYQHPACGLAITLQLFPVEQGTRSFV